jgi:hypothetical protein
MPNPRLRDFAAAMAPARSLLAERVRPDDRQYRQYRLR